MKDAEFIELLNLYVDQEISAADAARLEAEVQGNPRRRQTYQQYCRMQKACKLLTQDFQTSTTPAADRKVVAFKPAAWRATPAAAFAAIGAVAAAACLAVILVNRDHTVGGTSAVTVVQENPTPIQAPTVAVNAGSTQGIVHTVSVPRAQPAMVGNPLLLSGRANTDAMLAAAAEQANSQFAWMKSVQLSPLQRVPLEIRFEPPAVQADGSRTFRSPHVPEGPVEWAAYRFTK